MRAWPPVSSDRPHTAHRDTALLRPKRAARWVTGLATAAAAVIAGVVAHQLPGAASTSAPGSTSSTSGGSSTASTGTMSGSGSSSATTPTTTTPTIRPSTNTPTVVSGGSSVR